MTGLRQLLLGSAVMALTAGSGYALEPAPSSDRPIVLAQADDAVRAARDAVREAQGELRAAKADGSDPTAARKKLDGALARLRQLEGGSKASAANGEPATSAASAKRAAAASRGGNDEAWREKVGARMSAGLIGSARSDRSEQSDAGVRSGAGEQRLAQGGRGPSGEDDEAQDPKARKPGQPPRGQGAPRGSSSDEGDASKAQSDQRRKAQDDQDDQGGGDRKKAQDDRQKAQQDRQDAQKAQSDQRRKAQDDQGDDRKKAQDDRLKAQQDRQDAQKSQSDQRRKAQDDQDEGDDRKKAQDDRLKAQQDRQDAQKSQSDQRRKAQDDQDDQGEDRKKAQDDRLKAQQDRQDAQKSQADQRRKAQDDQDDQGEDRKKAQDDRLKAQQDRQDAQKSQADQRKKAQDDRQKAQQDGQDDQADDRKKAQEDRLKAQQDRQDAQRSQEDQRKKAQDDRQKAQGDRRDAQQDRREDKQDDRRDAKQDRREDKQDDRRDAKQDRREDKQDDRRDAKQDRREDKKDARRDDLRDGRRDQRDEATRREDWRRDWDSRRGERQEAGKRIDREEDAWRDRVRSQKRVVEERDGRTIFREGDNRVIVRQGDRMVIRHREGDRFRLNSRDVRVNRRDNGEVVTTYVRPDGYEIISIEDGEGRLLRRSRKGRDGREVVLIDNYGGYDNGRDWRERGTSLREERSRRRGGRDGIGLDVTLNLPPVRVDIPRDRYIVDAEDASYDDIEEAFEAPPVEDVERRYTLDEVRYNYRLRQKVRSVELNTINFAFGAWEVPDEQIDRLEEIGRAMVAVIEKNPDEVFLIEGHTDAVGSDVDNLALSDRRAEAVAIILSEYFKLPAENLVTQGYGEENLKIETEEPEIANRRVTVRRITPLLSQADTGDDRAAR